MMERMVVDKTDPKVETEGEGWQNEKVLVQIQRYLSYINSKVVRLCMCNKKIDMLLIGLCLGF